MVVSGRTSDLDLLLQTLWAPRKDNRNRRKRLLHTSIVVFTSPSICWIVLWMPAENFSIEMRNSSRKAACLAGSTTRLPSGAVRCRAADAAGDFMLSLWWLNESSGRNTCVKRMDLIIHISEWCFSPIRSQRVYEWVNYCLLRREGFIGEFPGSMIVRFDHPLFDQVTLTYVA